MGSTFSGIELGKRGLQSHSQALSTVGHNLQNASTEGYSRQRVRMGTYDPLYRPQLNREERPGQIGQGNQIVTIERLRDNLLQDRVLAQGDEIGYWETRDRYLLMLENLYNEPNDTSVRDLMDNFWNGWQELSLNPVPENRQVVLRRGESLMAGINSKYTKLDEIRRMINTDVMVSVDNVNRRLQDISSLNVEILKVQAMGDNPNDLLDSRDLLVEELSEYMNITVENRDPDEFQIHSGGLELIQGEQVFLLEAVANPDNDSFYDVRWAHNGEKTNFQNGKLVSLIEMRDVEVRGEIQDLDTLALNYTDMVNDIHSSAWTQNGQTGVDFFTSIPYINNISGNYDRSGDGEIDSTYVFKLSGTHELDLQQQVGLEGELTLNGENNNLTIPYYSSDTVGDIIDRINNSQSEVVATLDFNNKLTLKASPAAEMDNPDFVIRHVEDSGQFLVGYSGVLAESGNDGAFRWDQANAVLALADSADYTVTPLRNPSNWIRVNEEILNDPSSIAAGFGENGRTSMPGAGDAALAIASIRHKQVMIGQMTNLDDYFANSVAEIASKGEQAESTLGKEMITMKSLKEEQQSISGVNIDEEFSEMIKYQHGYNAAARFVTTIDKMLDTIINRMGV